MDMIQFPRDLLTTIYPIEVKIDKDGKLLIFILKKEYDEKMGYKTSRKKLNLADSVIDTYINSAIFVDEDGKKYHLIKCNDKVIAIELVGYGTILNLMSDEYIDFCMNNSITNFTSNQISEDFLKISSIVKISAPNNTVPSKIYCFNDEEYIKCDEIIEMQKDSHKIIDEFSIQKILGNMENETFYSSFILKAYSDKTYMFYAFKWYDKETRTRQLRSFLLKTF